MGSLSPPHEDNGTEADAPGEAPASTPNEAGCEDKAPEDATTEAPAGGGEDAIQAKTERQGTAQRMRMRMRMKAHKTPRQNTPGPGRAPAACFEPDPQGSSESESRPPFCWNSPGAGIGVFQNLINNARGVRGWLEFHVDFTSGWGPGPGQPGAFLLRE